MTEAKNTQESRLAVYIDGVKTFFAEVKSIPSIGKTKQTIEATHLGSECREYIPDIPGGNETLEFSMNAMPTGSPQSNYDLIKSMDPDAKYTWCIEYPAQGWGWTGEAYWGWAAADVGVSAVMELRLTLIVAGAFSDYSLDMTYSVTYDANGGTGTVTDATAYTNGETVTVKASTGLTAPEGKTFMHWNTKADNSGVSYNPDAVYKAYKDVTLYAIWRDDE